MKELDLQAADVAREAKTTEATISNWVKDNVQAAHVKAFLLFPIARAVQLDPEYLLLGEQATASRVREDQPAYASQDLKSEALTLAFQLATEAEDASRARGRTLPPEKRAELTQLAWELLQEGLPRAKVLRFVLAAAA